MPRLSVDDWMASRSTGPRSVDAWMGTQPRRPTWGETAALMGVRIGGTALGGGLGLFTANPLGVLAGGAAGAGFGEWGAQELEKKWGLRRDISPGVIATETALGAFAPGKAASIGRRMLWGGGQALASTGARTGFEEGRLPTAAEAGTSLAFGGGLAGLLGKMLPRQALEAPRVSPERTGVVLRDTETLADPVTLAIRDLQTASRQPDIVPPPRPNAGFGIAPLGRAAAHAEFYPTEAEALSAVAARPRQPMPGFGPDVAGVPRPDEGFGTSPLGQMLSAARKKPVDVEPPPAMRPDNRPVGSPTWEEELRRFREDQERVLEDLGKRTPNQAPKLAGQIHPEMFADVPDNMLATLGARVRAAGVASPQQREVADILAAEVMRRKLPTRAAQVMTPPPAPAAAAPTVRPRPGDRIVPEGTDLAAPAPTGRPKVFNATATETTRERSLINPDGTMNVTPPVTRLKYYRSIEAGAPSPEVAAAQRGVLATDPTAREGLRTFTEAEIKAGASRVKVEAIPLGQNFKNAQTAVAHLRRDTMEFQRYTDLLAKAQARNLGPGEAEELTALQAALPSYMRETLSARSEAGRTMRAFQFKLENRLVTVPEAGVTQAIKLGLDDGEIARRVTAFGNDLDLWKQGTKDLPGLDQIQREQTPLGQKIASYMTGNMLSGPLTMIRNLAGNTINLGLKPLMTPITAGVERLQVGDDLSKRTTFAGELIPMLKAMKDSAPEAWSAFTHVLRKGYEKNLLETTGGLDTRRVEFAGGIANPWNLIGRTLEGTDVFFRTLGREADLAGRMYAIQKKGLVPGTLPYIKAVDEARLASEKMAKRVTFQEDVPHAIAWLQHLKATHPNAAPVAQALIPFVKTPYNLLRQGMEFTPAGWSMVKSGQVAKLGDRASAEVRARAAAGTMGLAGLWMLAATGRLSGAGPKDPGELAELHRSGWKPNSVKIGDTWYNYSWIQPLALPASLVANAYESAQDATKTTPLGEKDWSAIIGQTLARTADSVLNQSFLAGVSALQDAIQDPERNIVTFLGRAGSSAVPLSGLLRSVAKATDQTIRKPTTGVEAIMAGIPGLSQQVPARLDQFGQPVTRFGGPLTQLFDPTMPSPVVHDPVLDTIKNLPDFPKPVPSRPQPTLSVGGQDVPLPKDQARALGQAKSQALYRMLYPLVTSPQFQAMPKQTQTMVLERAASRARQIITQRGVAHLYQGQPMTLASLLGVQ